MKKWIIILAIVVIVIVGGTTTYGFINSDEETDNSAMATTQTAVAELGNVEVNISGTGSILTMNEQTITFDDTNAVIEEVLVEVGDTVEEGDELITFEDDAFDAIEAPFSGEVTILNVVGEDTVSMGTEMIEITDYDNLQMIVNIDELDIAQIEVGQTAAIDVSAITDNNFTGTVTSVAKEANDSDSSVAQYAVEVTINEPEGIKVGMTAEATITTESKENVLTVPIEAIQTQGDQYYVLMEDTSAEEAVEEESSETITEENDVASEQVTIEVGLQNEEVAEITSGLSEGDVILLETVQASDDTGEETRQDMFQGGFGGGAGERPSGEIPAGGGMRPNGN
ncbi:efflux RND transporter periplasmic adaptor subunit [Paraliobacillus sediminis]|uniref:efflux RND transporter periplasmic adaptor subunit n=1 Tax=Paraliobacillus sediminis TaxID=1885916 RepID=UPI0013C3348C|nr:HlyD family efflux transporter periplasmic adaptor subunit [Paraliobacillus sediminis]